MEIYYSNNELYVEVNDRLNTSLINRLERKLSIILNTYNVEKINISIQSSNIINYNSLDRVVDELNKKYNCIFIVK